MVPLSLNDPDVIGYSACWGKTLMTLHAHRAGENFSFYKDFSAAYPRAVWIHLPMSSGERISEIWGRRGKIHDHMGLLVRFSRLLATSDLADSWKVEDKQSKTDCHWSSHIAPSAVAKWACPPSLDAAMCPFRNAESPLLQSLTSGGPSAEYQRVEKSECYLVNTYTHVLSENARDSGLLLLCCVSRGGSRDNTLSGQVGDPFVY